MARYFFHLCDHTDEIFDPDGIELASVDAVKSEALRAARDTLSPEIKTGVVDLRYRIDVEDVDGGAVHSLPLKDAFKVIEG
jgi:hypothetical protein